MEFRPQLPVDPKQAAFQTASTKARYTWLKCFRKAVCIVFYHIKQTLKARSNIEPFLTQ